MDDPLLPELVHRADAGGSRSVLRKFSFGALLRLDSGVDYFELRVNSLDLGRIASGDPPDTVCHLGRDACTFMNCRLNRARTVLISAGCCLQSGEIKIEVAGLQK